MPKPTTTEELREALASADRKGVGRAYPQELRQAVVAHVAERRSAGDKIVDLADELGLSVLTIQRWTKREATSLFRPVSVLEARIEGRARIVVHGPRGVRIEGLDPAGLADLLRRLG